MFLIFFYYARSTESFIVKKYFFEFFWSQHSSGRTPVRIRKGRTVCVRRVDGSQYAARHTTFRALLRSSSIQEPRYPPLGDLLFICFHVCALACVLVHRKTKISLSMINKKAKQLGCSFFLSLILNLCWFLMTIALNNDPSAGSPTETLLRLLLPLDDKAY